MCRWHDPMHARATISACEYVPTRTHTLASKHARVQARIQRRAFARAKEFVRPDNKMTNMLEHQAKSAPDQTKDFAMLSANHKME